MALTTVDAGLLNPQAQETWRNRIINGAMMIDQRNAGASVALNSSVQYRLDRWNTYCPTGSGNTVQQVADAPSGLYYSQKVTIGTGASPSASEQNLIAQGIEGYNVSDMGFGAVGASTFTLSFWVKSSVTGTFPVSFQNSGGTRSYVSTYTVNSANTWEQKTITVAGDTSGTWLKTNSAGIYINFTLGAGSNFNATANTWSNGDLKSVSGATSVVATSGATWYVTGVQLEKGSSATAYDYRPYGTELALCQRYCIALTPLGGNGAAINTTTVMMNYQLPVTMRGAPSLTTAAGNYLIYNGSANYTSTSTTPTPAQSSLNNYTVLWAGFTGLTSGQFFVANNGSTTQNNILSIEL